MARAFSLLSKWPSSTRGVDPRQSAELFRPALADYALAQIQQAALEARLASGGGEDTPAYAARGAYLLRHDQPSAVPRRSQQRLRLQRQYAAYFEDAGGYALRLKRARRAQGLVYHRSVGGDTHVPALAQAF